MDQALLILQGPRPYDPLRGPQPGGEATVGCRLVAPLDAAMRQRFCALFLTGEPQAFVLRLDRQEYGFEASVMGIHVGERFEVTLMLAGPLRVTEAEPVLAAEKE